MKLHLPKGLRVALLAAVSVLSLAGQAAYAATAEQTFSGGTSYNLGHEIFSGLYLTQDMGTGHASANASPMSSSVNITTPGDFRAVPYTLSIWVSADSLKSDQLLFVYGGGQTTSNDYGCNGIYWNASDHTLTIGRGKASGDFTSMTWKEKTVSGDLSSAIGSGEMVNFTISSTSASQAMTPTLWINGVQNAVLTTYAGNMNGTANPMNLYVSLNPVYGTISLTDTNLTELADIYGLMGISSTAPTPSMSLVWNGTTDKHEWNTSEENKNWLDNSVAAAFVADADVVFNADAASKLVSVREALQAGKITVTGADYTFNFSGEEGGIMAGDVVLSGRTLSLTGEGGLMIGNLKGGGTVDIGSDVFVMLEDDIVVASGETFAAKGAGSLLVSKLSCAGSATISAYSIISTLEVTGGEVSIDGPEGGEYKTSIGDMVSNAGTSISLANAEAGISGGNQVFKSNLSIGKGAVVTVKNNDSMSYGVTNTITVLEGGEMTFSNARFTMGSGNKIVMAGGSITGTGDGDNGALDYYRAGSMSATKASSASTISAPIRLRGVNVAVEVESEAELTLSGKLNESQGKGSLTKTGEGTLTLAGANVYTGGTTINAGAVKVTNATGLGNGNVVLTNGSLQVSAAVNLSSVTLSQTGGSITVDAGNSLTLGSGSLSSAIAADGTVSFTGGIALADAMKEETVAAGHINEFGNADKDNGFVQGSSKYVALVTKGESAVVTVGDSATFTYKSKNYTKDNVDADSGRLIVEAAAATDWTLFEISSGNHNLSDIQKEAGKHDSAKIATVEIAGGTLNVDSTDLGAGEIKATGGSVTLGQAVGTVTVGAASDLTLSGAGVISSVAVEDTATIGGVFNASAFSVVAGKTATVNDAASLGSLAVDGTLALQGAAKTTGGTVKDLTVESGASLTSSGALGVTSASGSGNLSVDGALTLTGEVELGNVTAGSVVLESGSSLTLSGNLSSAVVDLATVSKTLVMVEAGGLASSTGTDFKVDVNMVVDLGLQAGETVTLAKLSNTYSGTLTVNSESSIYHDGDQLMYVISQDNGTNNIILTAQSLKGEYVWGDNTGDDNWSTPANWAGNKVPDSTSWVQVDKSDSTINLDVAGEADRLTVYQGASAVLKGNNPLDIGSLMEVNNDAEFTIGEDGDAAAVSVPKVVLNGTLGVAEGASLEADSIAMTAGTLNTEAGSSVSTGVLTGDADSVLSGPVTVTGKGTRYQGNYAGATVAVAKGGDAVLYAGEDLNLAGAGSAQLVYTQDTAISSIQADGLTLTLNNAAADNSGVTLALEDGSSLKNGKILTGLSAVGAAATIDSADAPHLVSTAGASLKRSMAAPGLDLTGSTVVLTQSEGADVTQMEVNNAGKTKGLVLAYLGGDNTNAAVQLNGNLFAKYYKNARLQGGSILVDMNDTYYQGLVRPTTANGRAGAAMLDDAFVYVNPQQTRPDSDLAKVMDALENGAVRGSAADRAAAAVSGASAAAMGAAFGADVERQLRAIRNRTTSMGCAECVVNEEMPYVNAWVNAEGDYRKLDADNTLAGYKMSSWGATLGMDLDFTNRFTAGLAVTAMQGDFTADSADTATGDLDRLYLSAFARYSRRAWTHTAVATFGKADANLKRTVDYGTGSYTAKGDMSGTAFGLMYEVGYTKALTEDASVCLQPVFNISYRHSALGSYTETGSDAALSVGSREMDTVTFGLGARLQGTVGTSVYNRTSVVELRALAKLDAGDRDCAAKAGIAGLPATHEIKSAEVGAFGAEVGAGLLVPLGEEGGTLFFDAAAELRSGYTNVNGTVGYRFNF